MAEILNCPQCNGSVPTPSTSRCPRCGAEVAPAGVNPYQAPQVADLQAPQPADASLRPGGWAMASLALGILGMLIWCLPMIGLPVNLIGLVLGGKSAEGRGRSLAIAGIVLNAVGLLLNVLGFTLMLMSRSLVR